MQTSIVITLVHPDGSRTRGEAKLPLVHSDLNVALMDFYDDLDGEPMVERWEANMVGATLELTIYGGDPRAQQLTVRAICARVESIGGA